MTEHLQRDQRGCRWPECCDTDECAYASEDGCPAVDRQLILVCGSREWPEDALWFVTAKMIDFHVSGGVVLTGGARGVDHHAHFEAVRLQWGTHVIKPDWDQHGKRAGFLRNLAMLDEKPDVVLAFHWARSKGTAHTIREACKRGICVEVFNEESLRPDNPLWTATMSRSCSWESNSK